MIGKIRIQRQPGATCITDGKAVYIPKGARFRASDGSRIIATVETSEPTMIAQDKSEAVVNARVVDNHANILIGDTEHKFRPSFASSDSSPGRPDDACDWKQATLVAEPVGPFSD